MNEILQKRIEEAAENHEQCYNVGEEHGYLYTHKGDIKEAVIYGADFALQNQWISVEEALPEEDEQVIAMSEFGDIERMKYHNKAFYHLKGSIIKDGEKITHWNEIPSLEGGKE